MTDSTFRIRNLPMIRSLALVLLPAAFALSAAPASAQPATSSGAGPGAHAAILAGPAGSPGAGHLFAGLHASYSLGRFGAAIQGHLGSGNEFGSRFVAAGPTLRIPLHARVDVELMAGAAYYAERLDQSDRAGSVVGPAAGVLFRIPTGPVHVAVGLTGWHAEYTDEVAIHPIPASSLRFVVGVGR